MNNELMDKEKDIEVIVKNNVPMASSLEIARCFSKKHKHILRDIEQLRAILPKDFYGLNFELIENAIVLPHSGGIRKDKAYLLSRDAFSLLAMGFTGKCAVHWKIMYINAFNSMEKELKEGNTLPKEVIEFIIGPPKETPEIRTIRLQKVIKGYLVDWTQVDDLPLVAAETALLAYLKIRNWSEFKSNHYDIAKDFLFKAIGQLRGEGKPATPDQIKKIEWALEGGMQFKRSRDFNLITYLQDVYELQSFSRESLSYNDASKILLLLTWAKYEMLSYTTAFIPLAKYLRKESKSE